MALAKGETMDDLKRVLYAMGFPKGIMPGLAARGVEVFEVDDLSTLPPLAHIPVLVSGHKLDTFVKIADEYGQQHQGVLPCAKFLLEQATDEMPDGSAEYYDGDPVLVTDLDELYALSSLKEAVEDTVWYLSPRPRLTEAEIEEAIGFSN